MANHLFDPLFGCHAGSIAPLLHLPDGQTLSYDNMLTASARMANVF